MITDLQFSSVKVGDLVLIRNDLKQGVKYGGYNFCDDMLKFCNELVTVEQIYYFDNVALLREDRHDHIWTREMIQKVVEVDKKELIEDDRTYTNFKKGDLVKFRSIEDLEKHFQIEDGIVKTTIPVTTRNIEKNQGKSFVIKDVKSDGFCITGFKNKDGINFSICTDIIEIVEENYIEKMKGKYIKTGEDSEENEKIIKEMIDKVDVKKIRKILGAAFRKKGTSLLGIDKMLETWAKSKINLYKMLGNNLKVETDVEYNADENVWGEYIVRLCNQFPGMANDLEDISLKNYINNKIISPVSSNIRNRMGNAYKDGMALSLYFSKAYQNDKFDLAFSKYIDEAKVTGKIVVSIDPLDFILMSYNQSGWHSCLAISKYGNALTFGEFVGGIFSYIADNCTAISYRHSKEMCDYKLGTTTFKEYSKNWRELMYIDIANCSFIASRQYPRYDENISKIARSLVEEKLSKYCGLKNEWIKVTKRDSYYYSQYIEDCEDHLHYNDMLNGFEGKLLYQKGFKTPIMKLVIGKMPICPICR